jgi:dolichol-phosphate mannosyltransferase
MTPTTCAFILPTYRETQSVYELICQLDSVISPLSYIVIIDDSEDSETASWVERAFARSNRSREALVILRNGSKSGRGAAVRRGLEWAHGNTSAEIFVEMDSDGSHSPEMVSRVVDSMGKNEFVIGSRYMKESRIIGWPMTRRVFSFAINYALRRIFKIEVRDWTNGLRGYSRAATKCLISRESITSGFIFLSEQLIVLTGNGFSAHEIPIIFYNRTIGESTVTWRELRDSILGIWQIRRGAKALKS